MNGWKKQLALAARKLKRIKTWHLAVALVVFGVGTIICLRFNNLNMIKLRDQLLAADQTVDVEQIEQAATKLRLYSQHHMNADTGQVALQNLYNKRVQEAFAAVNNDVDASGYASAAENCQPILNRSGYQGYADCVAASVGLSGQTFKTPALPNPAMYYLNYTSPLISLDLAGVFSVFLSVVVFAMLFKLITEVVLGLALRFRGKK